MSMNPALQKPLNDRPTDVDVPKPVSGKSIAHELSRRDEVIQERLKQQREAAEDAKSLLTIDKQVEDVCSRPGFFDPMQRILIFNVAHRGQRPIKDRPATRLNAVFEKPLIDPDNPTAPTEAKLWLDMVGDQLYGCNLWQCPLGKWFLLCKNMERQSNPQYAIKKINVLKQLHERHRQRRDADFQNMRKLQSQGETGMSLEKQRLMAQKQAKDRAEKRQKARSSSRLQALRAKGKGADPIEAVYEQQKPQSKTSAPNDAFVPRQDSDLNHNTKFGTNTTPQHLTVKGQDYAVVSWLRDITKASMSGGDDPEPACIVWRVFPNFDMARKWIEDIGKNVVRYFDMEVVDMNEWLFPEDVDREQMQEGYRDAEQGRMMDAIKNEKRKVENYEQECKHLGVKPAVMEVDAQFAKPQLTPAQLAQQNTSGSGFQPMVIADLEPRQPIKPPQVFDVQDSNSNSITIQR